MPGIPPEIEVSPRHHLPIINASADQRGLVSLITHHVPPELAGDAGTVVLGLVWDPRRGRRPLDRFEECVAHHATERLLGQAVPSQAWTDDTVGRVLDRLDDRGTMQLVTACAVRAAARLGVERRDVHVDPTSRRVWGDSPCAAEPDVPCPVTSG